MRISSGIVGMESVGKAASFTIVNKKASSQGSVNKKAGYFGGLLGKAGTATYSVNSVREESREEMIQRIKQQCIFYLIKLFFGIGEEPAEEVPGKPVHNGEPKEDTSQEMMYFRGEYEEFAFSTVGKVITGDGREIDFGLSLGMTSTFSEYYEERGGAAVMYDPLVINLDGTVPSVSDMKFTFDLDSDGTGDRISTTGSGNGFLAIDRNNDGVINDGSELFGTKSGDGFMDLRAYDSDLDGFIDEDDEIFDKLLIYCINDDGTETIYKLKDKGIGAICLTSAKTGMNLRGISGINARMRQTGVFLYENGEVGTLSQIDMVKK